MQSTELHNIDCAKALAPHKRAIPQKGGKNPIQRLLTEDKTRPVQIIFHGAILSPSPPLISLPEAYITEKILADDSAPSRRVMVTHQFVTSGASADEGESDAEVGGIGNVSASVFDGFSYTALGHIHRAYNVGRETVRYCGSPLKLSFSEVEDEKSVTVVEIDADGGVNTKTVAISPIRDMREIRGSYEHVTSQNARESGPIDDYIRIVLTDDEMIEDVSAKLRCIYPNLMRIAYDNNRTREIRDVTQAAEQEIDAISPLEVFAELFELQNNASPDEEILKIAEDLFSECTEDFRGGERA